MCYSARENAHYKYEECNNCLMYCIYMFNECVYEQFLSGISLIYAMEKFAI